MKLIKQQSNGMQNLRMSREEAVSLIESLASQVSFNLSTGQHSVESHPISEFDDNLGWTPSSLITTIVPKGQQ